MKSHPKFAVKSSLFVILGLLAVTACQTTTATTDASRPSDAGSDTSSGGDAGPREERFAAIITGRLAAGGQSIHDPAAMGGESAAHGLGDVRHEVFLSTADFGGTAGDFLAIDGWTNLEGARTLYSDPSFGAALAPLFTAPPSTTLYARSAWYQWGSLDSADSATPRYFIVIRGTLASADEAASRRMHDAAAMAGESAAHTAGDVGHAVFLGAEDPQAFLAIDVWTSSTNIAAFYGNPDFQAALAPLFSAPPELRVYESTNWYQWQP